MNDLDQLIRDFITERDRPGVFIISEDTQYKNHVLDWFESQDWAVGWYSLAGAPLHNHARLSMVIKNARLAIAIVQLVQDQSLLRPLFDGGFLLGQASGFGVPTMVLHRFDHPDESDLPTVYNGPVDAIAYGMSDLTTFSMAYEQTSAIADHKVRVGLALQKLKQVRTA